MIGKTNAGAGGSTGRPYVLLSGVTTSQIRCASADDKYVYVYATASPIFRKYNLQGQLVESKASTASGNGFFGKFGINHTSISGSTANVTVYDLTGSQIGTFALTAAASISSCAVVTLATGYVLVYRSNSLTDETAEFFDKSRTRIGTVTVGSKMTDTEYQKLWCDFSAAGQLFLDSGTGLIIDPASQTQHSTGVSYTTMGNQQGRIFLKIGA